MKKLFIMFIVIGIFLFLFGALVDLMFISVCSIFIIVSGVLGIVQINIKKHEEQKRIEKEKENALYWQKEKEKKEKLRNSNYIVIDCETTGLKPNYDEILKLSIIDRNGNVLFNELIKPTHRKVWKKAQEINGISPSMVNECKTINDYIEQIREIINNSDIIVGYNVEFDMSFLREVGIGAYLKPTYDVMEHFCNEYKNGKYVKLENCASYFGYEWEGKKHDSLADTRATLYCFKKMIE